MTPPLQRAAVYTGAFALGTWQCRSGRVRFAASSSSYCREGVAFDADRSSETTHYRNHPRVSVPRELPQDLSTRPFDAPIERCTAEDKATMLRQIKKRRVYPLGACRRCKHGYPQAYLHAPMHAPAATVASLVRMPRAASVARCRDHVKALKRQQP